MEPCPNCGTRDMNSYGLVGSVSGRRTVTEVAIGVRRRGGKSKREILVYQDLCLGCWSRVEEYIKLALEGRRTATD
jgi:hypothetical protein